MKKKTTKGSGGFRILAFIALIILGIYLVPQATAKYSGSHTWEANNTEGIYGLGCTGTALNPKCHRYITVEMDATALSADVAQAHLDAAWVNVYPSNTYVGNNLVINISRAKLPQNPMPNVCLMCHLAEQDGLAISGTHTKLIIRVCTDLDCHGDQSGTTMCTVFSNGGTNTTCNVTGRLNNSLDSHSNFYRPLSTRNSTYPNEDGNFYDQGFYTCLACHSHVGMDFELDRPNQLILNMSYNVSTGLWQTRGSGLSVNSSIVARNISLGGKSPGSVW